MIWFFTAKTAGASPSIQITPVVIYLVFGCITIGSCLRESKFSEEQARVLAATSPQIKLDMARSDINETLSSTTRIIKPSYNRGRAAHCDVVGLFDLEPQGCMIPVPPAVEIEVKKVIENARDAESTHSESEYHSRKSGR